MNFNNIAVATGNTNPELARLVAEKLSVELIHFDTTNWTNGQPRCIREKGKTVNGKIIIIVQSLRYDRVGSPVEELKMIFNGCKGAAEVHIVISWMCTKDDVQHSSGQVPASAIIADEIRSLVPKSILVFDLHQSSHSQFFYSKFFQTRHFYLLKVLMEKAIEVGVGQVAAADFSGSNRANKVNNFIKTGNPLILAAKDHDHQKVNAISHQSLYGHVVADTVGIFDDMALTLGTMIGAAKQIKFDKPTARVYGFAVHFDPAPNAYDNLLNAFDEGLLDGFFTTNTNKVDQKYLELSKFSVIDVSLYVASAVELIVTGRSTSKLFLDI